MRKILFRGKRIVNGEWVYGDYCQPERLGESGDEEHIIIERPADGGEYYVIPETVGQFTGLTDRNGNKIFEGDIVKYGDTIHEVVFEQRNKTAYFGMVYSEIETLPFGHYQDLRQIEVIGNIYDNPELLNATKTEGYADNGGLMPAT